MMNPLAAITLLAILLRPQPLPSHSNIFSYPFTPLYSPSAIKVDLLTHPFLESLRGVAFNYFNYLSPKFLFTILYPIEIIFVGLGIYYLANSKYNRLNQFWFALIVISPLVSGLLLIIPLSILIAAGLIYL